MNTQIHTYIHACIQTYKHVPTDNCIHTYTQTSMKIREYTVSTCHIYISIHRQRRVHNTHPPLPPCAHTHTHTNRSIASYVHYASLYHFMPAVHSSHIVTPRCTQDFLRCEWRMCVVFAVMQNKPIFSRPN